MSNIDVIIPLYNGEKWIEEAIQSVLSQSHKPHQIIVVDDGSTDGSVELVLKIPEVILIRNPEKSSATSARNTGLGKSTAEYVAFLDQDDLWHPKHLEILLEELEKRPTLPAVASFSKTFEDGSKPHFDLSNKKVEITHPWDNFPFSKAYAPGLFLYRRWVFGSEGWPLNCGGKSDYVMWFRISVKHQIPRVTIQSVARREHSQAYFNQILKHLMEFLFNWTKMVDELQEYYLAHEQDSQKEQWLKRRTSIIHVIIQLMEAIQQRDKKLLIQIANELEALLIVENMDFRKISIQSFVGLVASLFTDERDSNALESYEFLLESWPREALITKKILTVMIIKRRPGLKFYKNYFFKNPFQVDHIFIALKVVQMKLCKEMV